MIFITHNLHYAYPSYEPEWKALVAAVQNGTSAPAALLDGRAPMLIGLAAWRSLREERRVRVEEIDLQ